MNLRRAADPFERMPFEYAQELGLCIYGHYVADFIQKRLSPDEQPRICLFFVSGGSEGSFFMAEQFAF